jgi:transmembrane sensor
MTAPEDPIARQAAEWLVRHDRGFTGAEQDEFFQWLAADPRHGEWFARHQRAWRDFNLLAEWRPEHSAEPNPDLLAKPHRSFRWLAWSAPLAAAAALAIGYLASPSVQRPVAPVAVASAAAATAGPRVLDDGSTIELRPGSEVNVAYTPSERRVDLLRGEAFFTVAKNPGRPFIVHANGVDVRAVGTAFNVRLDRQAIEVLVTEGRVQLAPPASPGAPPTASPSPQLVAAGERAVVAITAVVAPPQVASVSEEEIARALAWQPRLLDFNSTPLAEVVREFNRRNRVQLELGDAALGQLPIVASIRSDNVEGFVRLLESSTNVRAERRGDRIVLRESR